jgi:hypothetical protein
MISQLKPRLHRVHYLQYYMLAVNGCRETPKNALAVEMTQAVVASAALHVCWVLADEAFGRDTAWLDAVADLDL